jgi:hypothetical protein
VKRKEVVIWIVAAALALLLVGLCSAACDALPSLSIPQ